MAWFRWQRSNCPQKIIFLYNIFLLSIDLYMIRPLILLLCLTLLSISIYFSAKKNLQIKCINFAPFFCNDFAQLFRHKIPSFCNLLELCGEVLLHVKVNFYEMWELWSFILKIQFSFYWNQKYKIYIFSKIGKPNFTEIGKEDRNLRFLDI